MSGPCKHTDAERNKGFFFGVAKLRIGEFGTVGTYLPWQHGGSPSRAGEINTQREAEGALVASRGALGPLGTMLELPVAFPLE